MEFETFRRLPESRFILFTVRTYQDPVRGVERAPVAAQALSGAVRRAHKGLLHYHNLVASGFDRGVLAYLDGVALSAGLRPFRGVVAEPWEREPPEDGTWAPVSYIFVKHSRSASCHHPLCGNA